MRPLLTLLLPAALLAGCGRSDSGPIVAQPVTGKVVYDGKPAGGVEVTLFPTDAPAVPRIPRNPHAVTKADGTFAVSTFADGDGAAEGGYTVLLSWPKGAAGEESADSDATDGDRLFGWYDAAHSKFTVRVKAGRNELPVFNLPKHTGPPPISEGIPGRN